MKKTLLKFCIVLILSFPPYLTHSQSTTLNWIFFINGKIPESTSAKCKMIVVKNEACDTIPCEYYVGKIMIQKPFLDQILKSESDSVILDFTYTDYSLFSHPKYKYSLALENYIFKSSFLIFNIDNISIKRKEFYLEILGDGFKTIPAYPRRKSMYNVFPKIELKRSSKRFYNQTIIMRKVPIK